MSREIKFRVWDGEHMRYLEHGEFQLHYCGVVEQMDYSSALRDWPLMQFTGLKDKNGKEIYEGDFVRVVGAESGEMVVHVDDITMMPLSALYPDGEVIGNIHENPDLLEGA